MVIPTATASKKENEYKTKQPNANPKEPKKKARKPYKRDENGNIIRPNKENQTSVKKRIIIPRFQFFHSKQLL